MNPDDLFTIGCWFVVLIISLFAVAGILHVWIYLYDRKERRDAR